MSDLPPPPPPPPPSGPLGPPPGYVAYGGPGSVSRFQPIRGLTTPLRFLLIASVAVSVITLLIQLTLRGRAQDYVDGVIGVDEFEDGLGLFLLIGVLAALVTIAQLVLLCIWTFRLAKNMQQLGRQGASLSSPGATVAINILGGCTLGILNFFMWREIWRGSDPDSPPGDPAWKQRAVDNIIAVWLALTVTAALASAGLGIGRIATGGMSTGGNTDDLADQFTDGFGVSMLSGALSLAAGVVFIVFIGRLAARHMQATGEA